MAGHWQCSHRYNRLNFNDMLMHVHALVNAEITTHQCIVCYWWHGYGLWRERRITGYSGYRRAPATASSVPPMTLNIWHSKFNAEATIVPYIDGFCYLNWIHSALNYISLDQLEKGWPTDAKYLHFIEASAAAWHVRLSSRLPKAELIIAHLMAIPTNLRARYFIQLTMGSQMEMRGPKARTQNTLVSLRSIASLITIFLLASLKPASA